MVVGEFTQETDLLIIGGGPGGYTAAFRAAQLGVQTTLVDERPALGGVCLHEGCIPAKAQLNVAETLHVAEGAATFGVEFQPPVIDLERLRTFVRTEVIDKLAGGLDRLCERHGVERLHGRARFEDSRQVTIPGGPVPRVRFRRALVATGSRAVGLAGVDTASPRVLDATGALALDAIPKTLLVVGGGYIGLELGQVYAALGAAVTLVEMETQLLPGADADLVRPLARRAAEQFEAVAVATRVVGLTESGGGLEVRFADEHPPRRTTFERVLVAVGRAPNTGGLGLEKTAVEVEAGGFIRVDHRLRTADPRIFAIGDAVGGPMLAHKAVHEGKIVADVLAGRENFYDARAVPAVVFTDPEVAWAGLTEGEARAGGRPYLVRKMPWSACGRAVAMGRAAGLTKLLSDPGSGRILGVGMVGAHAGELIAEGVLAIEMGATETDLTEIIHPHPTLSEMTGEVAELMEMARRAGQQS